MFPLCSAFQFYKEGISVVDEVIILHDHSCRVCTYKKYYVAHLSAVTLVCKIWGNPLRLQESSAALWYGNIMFLFYAGRQGRCFIDSKRLIVVTPFSQRLIRMEYLLLSGNISCKDFKYTCNFYASWALACSWFSIEKNVLLSGLFSKWQLTRKLGASYKNKQQKIGTSSSHQRSAFWPHELDTPLQCNSYCISQF